MQSIGLQNLLADLCENGIENGSLSMVNLQERAIESLFFAVDKNRTLKHLQLQDCQISDRSCNRIAETLQRNSTLRKLDLSNNQIGFKGAMCLLRAISVREKKKKGRGPALQQLLLDGNRVPPEVISDINDQLQANNGVLSVESKEQEPSQHQAPVHHRLGLDYDKLRAEYESNNRGGRPESRGRRSRSPGQDYKEGGLVDSRGSRPKSRSRRDRGRPLSRSSRKGMRRSQSPGGGALKERNPWEGKQSGLEGERWEAVEVAEGKREQLPDEREQLLAKLRMIEEAKGLLEGGRSESSMRMREIMSDIGCVRPSNFN